MIKLIKLIIFGHLHSWEHYANYTEEMNHKHIRRKKNRRVSLILKCKKCGNIKKVPM